MARAIYSREDCSAVQIVAGLAVRSPFVLARFVLTCRSFAVYTLSASAGT